MKPRTSWALLVMLASPLGAVESTGTMVAGGGLGTTGSIEVGGTIGGLTGIGFMGSGPGVVVVVSGNAGVIADSNPHPPANRPPVLMLPTVRTRQETPVELMVTANDPNDPDGDMVQVQFSAPSSGTIIQRDQRIIYQPPRKFSGIAFVQVHATDGMATTSAILEILVTADEEGPPIICGQGSAIAVALLVLLMGLLGSVKMSGTTIREGEAKES
jgi:hypothetical protein